MGVLVVDAIHICFSHGLLEQMVFYKYVTREWTSTTLFFRRVRFDEYPHNKLHVVGGAYVGWIGNWLNLLIQPSKVLFEHLGDTLPSVDVYHMPPFTSLWNDGQSYPGRPQLPFPRPISIAPYVYMIDDIRKSHIQHMISKNHMFLIDRNSKYGRHMPITLKRKLLHIDGTQLIIPDDWTPEKQIDYFRQARVVIFRHGSILSNLIWCNPGTIAVDIDDQVNRKAIIDQICKISGCKHVYLPNRNYNHIKNIVQEIAKNMTF